MAEQATLKDEEYNPTVVPMDQLDQFTSGSKVPVFGKLTDATITEASWLNTNRKGKSKEGDENDQYCLKLTIELKEPVEGVVEVYSNMYLAVYPDATGKPTRVYWGKSSDAQKFRTLVIETFGLPKDCTVKQIIETVNGKKVKIISEARAMPGQPQKMKPLVKQFVTA